MNIKTLEQTACTGCGACFNICPTNAIIMSADQDGFRIPVIESSVCTDCGLCVKSCPIINIGFSNAEPKCYAAMASDAIREVSSSGGIFTLLAEYVLANGGYICGAIYDDDWSVKHVVTNNHDIVYKMRGSKYVQSDTQRCFLEIKSLLEQNKTVLFSGCPCQVSGLDTFLSKKYENLVLVDFKCNSVPSPKAWQIYLAENLTQPIKNIDFRDKKVLGGWGQGVVVEYLNGERKVLDYTFFRNFIKHLTTRRCCTPCLFAGSQRAGDITIGDFWGIKDYNPAFDDGKGTSLVLVNNSKGEKLLNKVSAKLKLYAEVPLEYGRFKAHEPNPKRRYFFSQLGKRPFNELTVEKFTKHDIGILSFAFAPNYGAILTAFAYYKMLERLGYDAIIIDSVYWTNPPLHALVEEFFDKYDVEYTKLAHTKDELRKLNEHIETFTTGSDQLWNYWIRKSKDVLFTYLMDFVDINKKKFAYATSTGENDFTAPKELWAEIEYYFSRMDAISVREDTGVQHLKQFNIEATQVLDPVFFMSANEYMAFAAEPSKEPYTFTYIIYPDIKSDSLSKVLSKLDLPLIEYRYQITNIEGWISGIAHCRYMVTDSFHGMCFAIIFRKPFVVYDNLSPRFARMKSLAKLLGLQDRFVTVYMDPQAIHDTMLSPINWTRVEQILNAEISRSVKWLENVLQQPVRQYDKQQVFVENRIANLESQALENARIADLGNAKSYNYAIKDCLLLKRKYKIYIAYLRYQIFSKLSFGKQRKRYKDKKAKYHEIVRKIRYLEEQYGNI